jgi:hypothetical protein
MKLAVGRWSARVSPLGRQASPRALRLARIFVRVWAGLVMVFGVTFAVIGAIEWDRAAESASWPTAPGVVTESRVVRSTRRTGGRTRPSSSAHVEYAFDALGVHRTASRVGFRMGSSSEESAREVVARYPVGTTVTVRYSPDDPALACLEPGTGDWQWVPIAIGVGAVLFGGVVGWFVPKSARLTGRQPATSSGVSPPSIHG